MRGVAVAASLRPVLPSRRSYNRAETSVAEAGIAVTVCRVDCTETSDAVAGTAVTVLPGIAMTVPGTGSLGPTLPSRSTILTVTAVPASATLGRGLPSRCTVTLVSSDPAAQFM